jgi:hypothetical protein
MRAGGPISTQPLLRVDLGCATMGIKNNTSNTISRGHRTNNTDIGVHSCCLNAILRSDATRSKDGMAKKGPGLNSIAGALLFFGGGRPAALSAWCFLEEGAGGGAVGGEAAGGWAAGGSLAIELKPNRRAAARHGLMQDCGSNQ